MCGGQCTVIAQETPCKPPTASDLDTIIEGFNAQSSLVQENNNPDDGLREFEEDKNTVEKIGKREEREKSDFWNLSGSFTLGGTYNFVHDAPKPGETDYRGLSRLRPELLLDLDLVLSENWKALISGKVFYDFAYEINGRDQYTGEVLDEYEKEADFHEVYLQGVLLPSLDLKVGRQIVAWGKSDNIRVVDILNPLDNREPCLVDIEDLHLPVTMTKLDYYFGHCNLNGIAVHEIRFNKDPVYGSDFFPADAPLPEEKKPVNTLENTEYAVAMNGIFSGWDISIYSAWFFDDQSHVQQASSTHLERRHSRLKMIGTALNIALGNWLVKSELAYFDGLEFFALPGEERSRLDVLCGVEYSGFLNTTISLEAVNRHIYDFESSLKNSPDNAQEDEFQTVLRYSGDFFYDTLHLVMLASTFGTTGEDGALQRFSVEYDVTDAFSVRMGVVTYQSGDEAGLRNIGDNDRSFLDAKYSF